jgi:AmmeMemoRadiSam system protein B
MSIPHTHCRLASHAGSWYSANAEELDKQLQTFLDRAPLTSSAARALICPHAGYSYSGHAAAHSYKNLNPSVTKRIFVLGPSHHVYTTVCKLSSMREYATPLGNMRIDTAVLQELYATGHFEWMTKEEDEDEHSIEMQLPYIQKLMKGSTFSVVPVMVGSLKSDSEQLYGSVFAKYLDDPENFFIISSDFCHWGKRFGYYLHEPEEGPIHKFIEVLDRRGMSAIESQDLEAWYTYMKKYKNTICGRHPIGVFLQALRYNTSKHTLQFVHYSQSNAASSKHDSSVSYAACVITRN